MVGPDPSVVSGAGEFFTSLESVIGCTLGPLPPLAAGKDPRVCFCHRRRPFGRGEGREGDCEGGGTRPDGRPDTAGNQTAASFPGEGI